VGQVEGERCVDGAGRAAGPRPPPSTGAWAADRTAAVVVYWVPLVESREDAHEPDRETFCGSWFGERLTRTHQFQHGGELLPVGVVEGGGEGGSGGAGITCRRTN